MAQKCVHKGCGKTFTDENEDCLYHPGPPEFHEGQKGWKCCKPRVLTFDEFMTIPPCTTGRHCTVDDTPAPEPKTIAPEDAARLVQPGTIAPPRQPQTQATPKPPSSPAPPPEDESDDPDAAIPAGMTCKRRGCNVESTASSNNDRDSETCIHHPGQALFHEGSKGWTCCKRRVLEFDEFLKIEGCTSKKKHMFVGKKKEGEEKVESVRSDFYQTPSSVIASLYLKKIDKERSTITFSSPTTVELDLHTSDHKRYQQQLPLYSTIDTEKSSFKIMGTKLEFNLVKTDGAGWPVLRSDERHTGEIIQSGKPRRV